jgi:hypothetical protein
MLRYTETILQKVSFNKELFKRELIKAVKWLQEEEVPQLKAFVVLNFGNTHYDVINEVFRQHA